MIRIWPDSKNGGGNLLVHPEIPHTLNIHSISYHYFMQNFMKSDNQVKIKHNNNNNNNNDKLNQISFISYKIPNK